MSTNVKTLEGIHVTKARYRDTNRGVAFIADLYMDNEKIGYVENKGDGGASAIEVLPEFRQEFKKRMDTYFTTVERQLPEEEQFVEHLIDMQEFGKVIGDFE